VPLAGAAEPGVVPPGSVPPGICEFGAAPPGLPPGGSAVPPVGAGLPADPTSLEASPEAGSQPVIVRHNITAKTDSKQAIAYSFPVRPDDLFFLFIIYTSFLISS